MPIIFFSSCRLRFAKIRDTRSKEIIYPLFGYTVGKL